MLDNQRLVDCLLIDYLYDQRRDPDADCFFRSPGVQGAVHCTGQPCLRIGQLYDWLGLHVSWLDGHAG